MAISAVREVEAPVDLLVAVGAVALVADVEGEDGAAVRRGILVEGEDVREENLVRGGGGAGQVAVAVVVEVVGGEAQEGVDVLAVIEPLVGRVAAVDGVALAREVAGVGVRGGAEVLQLGEAREEGTLRVDGAAGEDVVQELAVLTLRQDLMVGAVGGVPVHALHAAAGEVGEGL